MIKRLALALVLILALLVGSVPAAEDGQVCTLMAGEKIYQVMPDSNLKGVITPDALDRQIGQQIENSFAKYLNDLKMNKDVGIKWDGANMGMVMVDFGGGPVPVMVLVRDSSVKDCK
jgi:hypothetical protein